MSFDPFNDQQEEDGIDLTPLIDVVFMLLIFFVLSTVFLKPAIKVDLPTADHAGPVRPEQDWLVISIDADGRYHAESGERTMTELLAILDRHPESAVNFQVDKQAPFEPFIKIIDQIKARGREDIIVTTACDNQPD
jgi:biopolymer transport protein ExbD